MARHKVICLESKLLLIMDLFRHKIFVNGSQIKNTLQLTMETAPCKSIDQHVCNYQFKI